MYVPKPTHICGINKDFKKADISHGHILLPKELRLV